MLLLRVHATPREGGDPLHCDRLVREGKKFKIEWGVEIFGEECEHVTTYSTYDEALSEWEVFPRDGEEVLEKIRRKRR